MGRSRGVVAAARRVFNRCAKKDAAFKPEWSEELAALLQQTTKSKRSVGAVVARARAEDTRATLALTGAVILRHLQHHAVSYDNQAGVLYVALSLLSSCHRGKRIVIPHAASSTSMPVSCDDAFDVCNMWAPILVPLLRHGLAGVEPKVAHRVIKSVTLLESARALSPESCDVLRATAQTVLEVVEDDVGGSPVGSTERRRHADVDAPARTEGDGTSSRHRRRREQDRRHRHEGPGRTYRGRASRRSRRRREQREDGQADDGRYVDEDEPVDAQLADDASLYAQEEQAGGDDGGWRDSGEGHDKHLDRHYDATKRRHSRRSPRVGIDDATTAKGVSPRATAASLSTEAMPPHQHTHAGCLLRRYGVWGGDSGLALLRAKLRYVPPDAYDESTVPPRFPDASAAVRRHSSRRSTAAAAAPSTPVTPSPTRDADGCIHTQPVLPRRSGADTWRAPASKRRRRVKSVDGVGVVRKRRRTCTPSPVAEVAEPDSPCPDMPPERTRSLVVGTGHGVAQRGFSGDRQGQEGQDDDMRGQGSYVQEQEDDGRGQGGYVQEQEDGDMQGQEDEDDDTQEQEARGYSLSEQVEDVVGDGVSRSAGVSAAATDTALSPPAQTTGRREYNVAATRAPTPRVFKVISPALRRRSDASQAVASTGAKAPVRTIRTSFMTASAERNRMTPSTSKKPAQQAAAARKKPAPQAATTRKKPAPQATTTRKKPAPQPTTTRKKPPLQVATTGKKNNARPPARARKKKQPTRRISFAGFSAAWQTADTRQKRARQAAGGSTNPAWQTGNGRRQKQPRRRAVTAMELLQGRLAADALRSVRRHMTFRGNRTLSTKTTIRAPGSAGPASPAPSPGTVAPRGGGKRQEGNVSSARHEASVGGTTQERAANGKRKQGNGAGKRKAGIVTGAAHRKQGAEDNPVIQVRLQLKGTPGGSRRSKHRKRRGTAQRTVTVS